MKETRKKIASFDPVTLQLRKLFDGTFVFHFIPEAAFPASGEGDGNYGPRVFAPYTGAIPQPLSCTYGCKGTNVRCDGRFSIKSLKKRKEVVLAGK